MTYGEITKMSPVEDDPAMWAALCKFFRQVMDGLSFTTPFIGPAFIGALLSVTRKSYRKKGVAYWASAVCWSTAAGAVLTPAFAHLVGISGDIAGSAAALVAILGHESIGFFFRHFGVKAAESETRWDGVERRSGNIAETGGQNGDIRPRNGGTTNGA